MFFKSCVILFFSSVCIASSIPADTSVKCAITESDAPIKKFDFDLYATGFPMAGVAMYSGMFEAKTPGLSCRTTRGHIYTRFTNDKLIHVGDSSCLENINFELSVDTPEYKIGQTYSGSLTLTTARLLDNPDKKTYGVTCQLQ